MSTYYYKKAISILDTFAKVKLFLVMLDLECDALVVEMFQNFLKITRSNHPPPVFSAMETIMTDHRMKTFPWIFLVYFLLV